MFAKVLITNVCTDVREQVLKDIVESQLKVKLEKIGVGLKNILFFMIEMGLKTCVADISPVNLQTIWKRMLGIVLQNKLK